MLHNTDCIDFMKNLQDKSVNLTLTDIPYDGVNRESGGIRNMDKGAADIITFDLQEFLKQVNRVTKGTTIIFCGHNQFSEIYNFFITQEGTTRPLVWCKNNPSVVNGDKVYLSAVELAVWHKNPSQPFNAKCKPNYLTFPVQQNQIHPTEKNHLLLQELILDNSLPKDLVFDPCAGSGSTLLMAKKLGRQFLGCELNKEFYEKASARLNKNTLF